MPTWNSLDEDSLFDRQLPRSLQLKAECHFTPLEVARRAARLLAPRRNTTVLDVGSGAGKFCIEAARVVPTARFVGIEWRRPLVKIAAHLARAAAVSNVEFIHGDALDLDWSEYDAFYLYNPFAEQACREPFVIDTSIALDPRNFGLYVKTVSKRLADARPGTRVVTYHGFGGPLPEAYRLDHWEDVGSGPLELWIKRRA
ncbi:MAG TPA: methyltransferase domain-containing protein [Kofleriaceae bacterium]